MSMNCPLYDRIVISINYHRYELLYLLIVSLGIVMSMNNVYKLACL